MVPSDEVTQEVDRAYRDLGKRAKVKGFRPGKVPRSVLEMYYGKQVEQEVSDSLVRRSLGEVLKEKDLEPVNLSWPEPMPPPVAGEDYRYSVELEVTPEFTVEDYQGLNLAAPEVAVSDEEVEARVEEIRQANALLKPLAEDRGPSGRGLRGPGLPGLFRRRARRKAARPKAPTWRWAAASSTGVRTQPHRA